MATLSRTSGNARHLSDIRMFLRHLEQLGLTWSQLVPQGETILTRPADLERVVNAGIRDHGLNGGTRASLNRTFGFVLQSETGRMRLAPVQPEHTDLMAALLQILNTGTRSRINRFLCHLEQQGLKWSQLVPPGDNSTRPVDLERVVNAGIRDHGLVPDTRAALNRVFGFALRPPGFVLRPPTLRRR